MQKIRLATRGSVLALTQSTQVKEQLQSLYSDLEVELVVIKTSGDQIQDRPLREVGGKGLFVKEIEEALLDQRADFAVHSMKDVPSEIPPDLAVDIILKRENPFDALISHYPSLEQMPAGSKIGTSSLRRKILLQKFYPHLNIVELRGNVDTRIRKLREKQFDGILLAVAGLKRLGRFSEVTQVLDAFIPAPAQGAIALETRQNDVSTRNLIAVLHHDETSSCVQAERVILKNLEGSCQLPLGAYAYAKEGRLFLKAFLASPDASHWIEESLEGSFEHPLRLGEDLSEKMFQKGARDILKGLRLTI